jgi:ribose-phosphate pyrophosphokinase
MAITEQRPGALSSIPQDYTKRLMVFGGRASMELAAKIAQRLDVDLGGVDLRTFADGEVYCRYEESIRGADVFLVQATAGNEA